MYMEYYKRLIHSSVVLNRFGLNQLRVGVVSVQGQNYRQLILCFPSRIEYCLTRIQVI